MSDEVKINEFKDSGTRQQFGQGAVRDAATGKGRFDLVPQAPIFLLARVYEMGAAKYASRNWEKGMPIGKMIDCAQRHLAKYQMGLRDEPHLSQALWNIVGALWMAGMVHFGLRDKTYNDLANHVGDVAWKGQEKVEGFDAPPLSPSEIVSLETFGMRKQENKNG